MADCGSESAGYGLCESYCCVRYGKDVASECSKIMKTLCVASMECNDALEGIGKPGGSVEEYVAWEAQLASFDDGIQRVRKKLGAAQALILSMEE